MQMNEKDRAFDFSLRRQATGAYAEEFRYIASTLSSFSRLLTVCKLWRFGGRLLMRSDISDISWRLCICSRQHKQCVCPFLAHPPSLWSRPVRSSASAIVIRACRSVPHFGLREGAGAESCNLWRCRDPSFHLFSSSIFCFYFSSSPLLLLTLIHSSLGATWC